MSLTDAGRRFLDETVTALGALDCARDRIRAVAAYRGEAVSVGATLALGGLDTTEILTRFRAEFPDVGVTLRTGLVADLLTALDAGNLDLVVGPLYAELVPESIAVQPLLHDELVLVVGPRTARRVRSIEDAAADPFACLPRGSGLRRLLDQTAGAHRLDLRVDLEGPSPQQIRALVAADLAVAVLARSVALGPGRRVVVRALDPAPSYPPVGLFARRRPTASGPVRQFADVVVAVAAERSNAGPS